MNNRLLHLSNRLNVIYLSGQTLNYTAYNIIDFLRKDNENMAKREFYHDGSKIPSYSRWGKEFLHLLYTDLGCRLHGVKNCDGMFCKEK